MSDATRRARARAYWRPNELRQWLGVAAAALFWGWLLFRWANDWLLDGAVISSGQPLIPASTFASVAESMAATADALGVLGWPIAQLGGLFSFLATGASALPALAQGAWLTVLLTVTSIVFGFVLAVPLAVMRVYGDRTAWLSLGYTELIRGTPLLAQLFVLYYGMGLSSWIRELPLVGVGFVPGQAVWIAIIGFTINGSAYQSEYIRAAIESVDSGQLTAARAVGMSKLTGIRYVVLPQGLRYAIPGWSNELVYLIKYSSLAAFITVPELFERADAIASETFEFTTMYALAALLYLGLVLSASKLMSVVEQRVAIPGLGNVEGREG
ncbi:amino acid ABC transporter permease [Halomicrococcus sp. NG-SE-24]|uniref:amino acid ABC transporter permease n=1 Tax=Halomicrococcus sp. NG-SE-24 TaxID=3436928 RepID=UPI003D9620DA